MAKKSVINDKLKQRLDQIDKIKADLQKAEKTATKEIMDLLKDLMAQNPLIEGVRWTQYTPHFNDGEECVFGINEPEFKFNLGAPSKFEDEDSYDGGDEGWYDDYYIDDEFFEKRADILNHKEIAGVKKAVKDINEVYSKLCSMERQMQSMFGDGVQVTVTASGVETEDYDHD